MVGLSESTREFREDQNRLNAAFTSAGMSAASAGETFAEMYRNIGESDTAVEAAQQIALLSASEQDAAKWADYAAGVVAKFGDALPVESFYESANETLRLGEATGTFTQMLEGCGVSVEDFNAELLAANTEQEKQAVLLKYTEMCLGDAAAAYKEANKDIYAARDAQLALNKSMAEAGAAVEPLTTILKQGLANALADLTPGITQVSQGLQDMFNGVEGGEAKLSEGIQNIVDSLLTTITNMLPTVLTLGVEIITALLNGIVQAFPEVVNTIVELIPQVIDALVTVIPQITGAVLGALPQLLEAVVQTIAAVAQGIAEMLPTIVEQVVEVIPMLIQTLIDSIPVLLEAAITLLMAIVEAIPEIIPPLVEALPELIDSLVTTLLDSIPVLLDASMALFMGIVDAIPEIIPALVDAIPEIIDTLVDGIIGALPQMIAGSVTMYLGIVQAIPKIIPQLLNGLKTIYENIQKNLIGKVGELFKAFWDGFKNGASKAWEGIKGVFSQVGSFFKNTFSNAWNAVKNIFSTGGKIFTGIKDGIVNAFKNIVNGIIGGINRVVSVPFNAINSALSRLKGIEIVGIRPFNWISTVSVPQIPKLAKGGIVDHATLGIFGENGTEAVMPLENNTEWIDILANRIAGILGANDNRTIVLQVDGKTFAQTAVTSINKLTRQQGKLAINLV